MYYTTTEVWKKQQKMQKEAGKVNYPPWKIRDTDSIDVLDTFHLGNDLYVQPMYYNGEPRIDLRQWFYTSDGEQKPTRRGIRLTSTSWLKLLGSNEYLVADISNVKKRRSVNKRYPLGADVYATITSPRWEVDLYLWYMGDYRQLRRSWRGISLKFRQWRKLMELSNHITSLTDHTQLK